MRTGAAILAILACIGLAILAGVLLGKMWIEDPMRVVEAQAAADWYAAWLPYRLALSLLAGLVGLGGLAAAAIVVWRWADMRARCVYPDSNGIMPAVLLRPGEVLADAGALPGPLERGPAGPAFPTIAPADLARLQAGANQGAAMTRSMRAWATRLPAPRESAPMPALPAGPGDLPPVEVLTGDEAHIYRLLASGEGEHGA